MKLDDVDWEKFPKGVTAEMVEITAEKRKVMGELSKKFVRECRASGLSPIDAIFMVKVLAESLSEQYGVAAMIAMKDKPGETSNGRN